MLLCTRLVILAHVLYILYIYTCTNWQKCLRVLHFIHISDDLYSMFVAIECRFFQVEKAHEMASSACNEGKITSCVLSNDDVLFYWCIRCLNGSYTSGSIAKYDLP